MSNDVCFEASDPYPSVDACRSAADAATPCGRRDAAPPSAGTIDRATGAELLVAHMPFLQRRCRSYGRTLRIDPDDLFGEVALRLLSGCPGAQVPCRTLNDTQAWLSTVVRNLSIDLARRASAEQRARATLRCGDADLDGGAVRTPLQEAMHRDLQRRLRTAFARLSAADRTVVHRRLWLGDDYEDIYASTAMKPANVRKRVQLSRQQMRECLADCADA